MSWTRSALLLAVSALLFVGCASSQQKQRREQRDKLVQSAKLYCEFLNGEQYPDIDVALNLQMAQKCDSDKSFSITSYKTPSEIPGVLFCCAMASKGHRGELPPGKSMEKPAAKPKDTAKPADDDLE